MLVTQLEMHGWICTYHISCPNRIGKSFVSQLIVSNLRSVHYCTSPRFCSHVRAELHGLASLGGLLDVVLDSPVSALSSVDFPDIAFMM